MKVHTKSEGIKKFLNSVLCNISGTYIKCLIYASKRVIFFFIKVSSDFEKIPIFGGKIKCSL